MYKLTCWFRESVKPVNKGVFEVRVRGNRQSTGYAFWNGTAWGRLRSFLSDFFTSKSTHEHEAPQALEWRGIFNEGATNA